MEPPTTHNDSLHLHVTRVLSACDELRNGARNDRLMRHCTFSPVCDSFRAARSHRSGRILLCFEHVSRQEARTPPLAGHCSSLDRPQTSLRWLALGATGVTECAARFCS